MKYISTRGDRRRRFRDNLLKAKDLCEEEIEKRKRGVDGEATIQELNVVLAELKSLLERVRLNQFPAKKDR